ncbi:MAG: aspartate--tRNA ligase [Candidatus Shapirobacteria bacterium]
MERTLVRESIQKVGQKVRLCGWVNTRRDHGKLVFLDVRDRSGLVQVVGDQKLGELRVEDVVEIFGVVAARPEKLVNPHLATGKVEIQAEEVKILAKSADLPFEVETDGCKIGEETRLKYRYLDLRRPRMARNLRLRHQVIKFIRDYLDERDFVEIETPVLTKATPEGARDFIVPSRLQPGNFYALPQSPQQYKQLLMVAGFEKYYQIARCFRDEDPRADRAYGEFTQLDLELSFSTQEEILNLIEELYKEIVKRFFPEKKLTFDSFPRLEYDQTMEKYGTDKPDLRKDKNDPNELAFCFVINFPLFEWKKSEKRWDAMHHPFTAPRQEDASDLLAGKNIDKLKSYQHDFVLNGYEIGGGSIRITNPKIQTKVFEIMGHTKKAIEKKFGHLLQAFRYGVPPHGGIAPGIDRFLMVILNELSLREVIAFPMTSSGQTAVMDAPSEVEESQLKELNIVTNVSNKK